MFRAFPRRKLAASLMILGLSTTALAACGSEPLDETAGTATVTLEQTVTETATAEAPTEEPKTITETVEETMTETVTETSEIVPEPAYEEAPQPAPAPENNTQMMGFMAPPAAPAAVEPPAPAPAPAQIYYKNCSAARAAGAAPIYAGQPGYGSHLDRDGDGIACE